MDRKGTVEMGLLKRCCFNCNGCSTAPDNQMACIRNKILKYMDIHKSFDQWCDKYEESNNLLEPYEEDSDIEDLY